MRDDIRQYLLTHRRVKEVGQFSDHDSLLEAGVIDSVMMVGIIAHLESTYGISVDDDDMVPEHFDSIDRIVAYVKRKRNEEA